MRTLNKRPWMLATLAAGLGIAITGCASAPVPVNKPCGVISDNLKDVHAKTRDGERRISDHYERGKAAGCWE